MPASYPSAIKTFTTLVDGVDDVLAAHQNDPNAEITAIETELGTNPRGTAADVKTRLAQSLNDDGTLKQVVNTAQLIDSAVTEAKHGAASVSQSKLKTATGEVSSAGVRVLTTLPGGEYGFYPQHKSSTSNNENAHFVMVGFSGFPVTLGTTFQTRITILPDSGQTLTAQQRYVTASGKDLWVFAIVDVATGDILAAWQAFDHPAYGNGGDTELVPHPFMGTPMPPGSVLVLLSKTAAEALLAEARIQRRGILDVLNEEVEPDLSAIASFVPLHSGLFDPDVDIAGNQRRDAKTGEMLWLPRMVTAVPAGVSVHAAGLMIPAKHQQRRGRAQARLDAVAQLVAQKAAKRSSGIAKLKSAQPLDDAEIEALFG